MYTLSDVYKGTYVDFDSLWTYGQKAKPQQPK